MKARTTEDIRRIMEYLESEVDRVTQRARHELIAFAANLGIEIARQSIKIDEVSDHELVKCFFEGLGDEEFGQTTVKLPVQGDRELAART